MKVSKKVRKTRTVTLRLAESTMVEIDKISDENGSSRQELIEKILEKAMSDPNFEIELSIDQEVRGNG